MSNYDDQNAESGNKHGSIINPVKMQKSTFGGPGANQYGQFSYYSHEDYKGEKVEFRNSKLIPLNETSEQEHEDEDGNFLTSYLN